MHAGRRNRVQRQVLLLSAVAAMALPLANIGFAHAQDPALIDWIRRTAQPFETCEPRDDQRDLASLKRLVGSAHIVALGEGTDGTREFSQLKHRIVAYLASEMGFTTFAIAANMPEASKLNDYVLTGHGDPKSLIAGLNSWPVNTEEMLAFVEWMHDFNASGRGHLRFLGFDMQKPDGPAGVVQQYLLNVDPAWADSVDVLASAIRRVRQSRVDFVTAMGEFPAKDAAGHRVRFSGLIRTQDVSGYAGLWWRADAGGAWIALDNMKNQQVAGTRDWQRYVIELDIPKNTDHISMGLAMSGTGRAWFDSLAIEIDGAPWSAPGVIDLAMDSADYPAGFSHGAGPGYAITMDDSAAAAGRWSLCLSSLKDFAPADAAPLWEAVEQAAGRVVRRFETEGPRYAATTGDDPMEWASRNAQLLLQWSRVGFDRRESVRDSSMAANVEWIIRQSPKGSKIVIWAHNSDVARTQGTMGDWLTKAFGKDVVVVGFATNEGQYTGMKEKLQANDLVPGPKGSVEALVTACGIPRFLLDLRRAEAGSDIRGALANGTTMRSIHALALDQQFFPCALAREYDVLAWVERTQPTRPLAKH